jgi:hypothetical protein
MGGLMMRHVLASLLAVVLLASGASAQAPKLRWTAGQVLLYRVELTTVATDQVGENKSETKSVVKVTKRWQVTGVDTAGTATLTLSLTSMYQQRSTPSGDTLVYDSANPDKSDPHLTKALSVYVNKQLATLRIDAQGKVVEVKESKSPATSYENELPFVALLPAAPFKTDLAWERAYKITLPPPLGTGEKYDAVQKCVCKSVSADTATVTMTTELKTPPKAAADAVPLWQMMPAGEIVYDLKNGRLHSAKLIIDREVKGHQGENSVCKFASTQTVQYVEK